MKKSFAFLFSMFLFTQTSWASTYSFRVQCAKKGQENFAEVFDNIPERFTFMLQNGSALYFSGGYFYEYESAKKRLAMVHNQGINEAFIRVFKNNSYVSDHVSRYLLTKYLERQAKKIPSLPDRRTKRPQKATEQPKAKTKSYSKKEYLALKKKRAIQKQKAIEAQEKIAKQKESLAIEMPEEDPEEMPEEMPEEEPKEEQIDTEEPLIADQKKPQSVGKSSAASSLSQQKIDIEKDAEPQVISTEDSVEIKNTKKLVKELLAKDGPSFYVRELPVFKILIAKVPVDNDVAPEVGRLPEVVYQSVIGTEKYYTLGNYSSYEKITEILNELKKDPKNENFIIIGTYRGSIVSRAMAKDLAEQYAMQNKK